MKAKELREKKDAELLKVLNESYDKLRDFRFQASVRKLKNPHQISATKKIIARILTILIERSHQNDEKQQEKN